MAQEGVTNDQLLTVINSTLPGVKFGSLQQAFGRGTYEVTNRWWAKDRVVQQGGNQIQDKIVLSENGSARHVRLYEPVQVNASDHLHTIKMDWTYLQAYWVTERREVLQNRTPQKIVSLLKSRSRPGEESVANMLEADAWATPDPTDDRVPEGIRYWVPQLALGQNGEGFYGGVPTGYTTVAGIAPATSGSNTTAIAGGESRWRSWCAGGTGFYTAVNDELLRTMTKTWIRLHFVSPLTMQDLDSGPKSMFRLYMNADTLVRLEELARKQNDQVGSDLGKFHGTTGFKRSPFINVDDLDSDTMDPIYYINHAVFAPYVLAGDNMRRSPAEKQAAQHNVFVVFIDHTYNYFCNNRQRNGVINKTA